MNDTLPIKKTINITFTFERIWRALFWSWRQFSHLLRQLHFCFNIVAVHPSFITCYDIFQKVFISIRTIKQFLTDCDMVLFLCICQLTRHTFYGNTMHLQFVGQNQVARTSRTVRQWFWRITSSTFSTWSLSVDVEGRPDFGSSLMDVLPDLKCWYHSWHCIWLKQSSPYACCNIWKVSINVFPNLKQNLTQMLRDPSFFNLQKMTEVLNIHSFKRM